MNYTILFLYFFVNFLTLILVGVVRKRILMNIITWSAVSACII